jgi:hypothetical protein
LGLGRELSNIQVKIVCTVFELMFVKNGSHSENHFSPFALFSSFVENFMECGVCIPQKIPTLQSKVHSCNNLYKNCSKKKKSANNDVHACCRLNSPLLEARDAEAGRLEWEGSCLAKDGFIGYVLLDLPGSQQIHTPPFLRVAVGFSNADSR